MYISRFTMFILFLCDILYVCIFFLGKDLEESDSGGQIGKFLRAGCVHFKN